LTLKPEAWNAMTRQKILDGLHQQLRCGQHIIGVVAGSGMAAKYTSMGGADLILALGAGKFRMMGRSSLASYLCYYNNNELVMELGVKDILPIISNAPVLFGLNACDPFISLYDYLCLVKKNGFSGIVNFPTMCLLDGKFLEALEEDGNSFDAEVEAVQIAHFLDLFTVAFVNNELQAQRMIKAGADVICAHFGFTKGGHLGVRQYLSLENAAHTAEKIFSVCDASRPVVKMIYGGPAATPLELQYIYAKSPCDGYIGGSTFDRTPIEKTLIETTQAFKRLMPGGDGHMSETAAQKSGCANFVSDYIHAHYADATIRLTDIARIAFLSSSYLSTKFKQETGVSFSAYLVRFRVEKAKELILTYNKPIKEIAEMVGYIDYAQFSKIFKKYTGQSPAEFRKANAV
jgi:predicted TIM-barrel enzyme/AraC-like DNA-binding protein